MGCCCPAFRGRLWAAWLGGGRARCSVPRSWLVDSSSAALSGRPVGPRCSVVLVVGCVCALLGFSGARMRTSSGLTASVRSCKVLVGSAILGGGCATANVSRSCRHVGFRREKPCAAVLPTARACFGAPLESPCYACLIEWLISGMSE